MDYSGKIIRKNPVTPSQTSASGVWTLDEAMQATKSNTWPVANVPDPISRSLRFRSSASANLSRTPATASNRKTFTWSGWVKRGLITSSIKPLFFADTGSSPLSGLYFTGTDTIQWYDFVSPTDYGYATTAVFRDPSAWYHVVCAVDTTQASASNRIKLYINGVQQTFNQNYGDMPQNYDTAINSTNAHYIGRELGLIGTYYDGYMTEINFIDGQALTPSSFGGTNAVTGVWEPRQYTGTYGTNGFLLTFSDITSTTTLGNDTSGNSNNWTPNNFSLTAGSTYDSMLDVPTQWTAYSTGTNEARGNYATLNPIDNRGYANLGFSNGNLTARNSSAGGSSYFITIVPDSGKYYFEGTATTVTGNFFSLWCNGRGYYSNGTSDGSASFGTSYTSGDVIGVAFDMAAGTTAFYKNGSLQGTQSGGSGGSIFFGISNSGDTWNVNFGQRPFAYTPPAGFLSLCTTNLPSPTILQGNQYMDVNTYTGNNTTNVITNSGGMQPDFVWMKRRDASNSHALVDVLRGTNKQLCSDTIGAEQTNSAGAGLQSFNSNGFTLGLESTATGGTNISGATYVAWQWKGNGTGVSNTAGSVSSTVSANTSAGFSIVTYTGNQTNGTVGHGLGVAPRMIIVKNRSTSDNNWFVYHASLGATQRLILNSTTAAATTTLWRSTAPTSTVFSVAADSDVNGGGANYVAYCFSEIANYSSIGSYTGNGNGNGPFVYTGFRPRYVLIRNTATSNWVVMDTSTSPINVVSTFLNPNTSSAESSFSSMDMLSNGFKIGNTDSGYNSNGATYIYACFAEHPFKNALAR
jgi:hypothetical protein